MPRKHFVDLSEQEILALAITNEEEDSRIYDSFAANLRANFPSSAKIFEDMAEEERGHRDQLFALYRTRFGERLLLVRREDVRGFIRQKPLWLSQTLSLKEVRQYAEVMEAQAALFYETAAKQTTDIAIRQLLNHLAEAERKHENLAGKLHDAHLSDDDQAAEKETERRIFVLKYVQPGLAGLMDGSVSTLAPVFAAAFATQNSWETFLVGLAASVGAGISMGFTEAVSDDGAITGRGSAWVRGTVCGVMTTLGGLGHTLPYLLNDFMTATIIAFAITMMELLAIAWIRTKYMDTPFLSSMFQVVVGGALVLAAGILIGHG